MTERARTLLILGALAAGVAGGLAFLHRQVASHPPAHAAADSTALELVTPAGTRRFTLTELLAALPAETVRVARDVSYDGRAKRYAGFALDRVLALGGARPGGGELLYFQAKDGYRASLGGPVRADGVHGVVAFRDLDAAEGWEPVGHGTDRSSPGPFYLVWADSTPDTAADVGLGRPWPYQLVRIEVVDPRRKYSRIYPDGVAEDDAVFRGYRAFVVESRRGDQCISCHSLNLQGGTVGPELNVPRSVTEYRDEATIAAFIRDASGFRAHSRMPSFVGAISDREIADILAYLRWLRERKVSVDSAASS